MKDDFEDQLRSALRPVDPGNAFCAQVMTRLTASTPSPSPLPGRPAYRWLSAGLVASVAVGICVTWQYQLKRAEGLEARRQLIEALRLTDQKLGSAYRIANSGT